MSKTRKHAIPKTRLEDYAQWYQEVVRAADLAQTSPVRGCMVIKPWGYSLWETIQKDLDRQFKALGCENAYFPLFIPLSYLAKEAEHVAGFAKECAVVTHHRLKQNAQGELAPDPESRLEEPMVVRPTSEMIVGEMFSKWIESYRDLPLKINQWSNIVRWEMRTRIFLRTAEILWQEGHTAHQTAKEAYAFTKTILDLYAQYLEEVLAIPVVCGKKSESEKFPGAEETLTFEAMMQDGKALQAGTSHFLGQNFSKAQAIVFRDPQGQQQYAYTTSWGVTTRLIGALIMVHSDDDGFIIPPKIAPFHVVIIPFLNQEETKEEILAACDAMEKKLSSVTYHGSSVRAYVDKREMRGGEKNWHWIKKGVPLRIEIGARDISSNTFPLYRRIDPPKEKRVFSEGTLLSTLAKELEAIQSAMYTRAQQYREAKTRVIETKEAFYAYFQSDKANAGGFALAHFSLSPAVETQIKQDLNVTVRCLPFSEEGCAGKCIFTGEKSLQRVLFAKAY